MAMRMEFAPNADPGDCRPRDWGPKPSGIAGAVLFQRLAHGHTVHVLDNGDAGCLQGLKGLGPDIAAYDHIDSRIGEMLRGGDAGAGSPDLASPLSR